MTAFHPPLRLLMTADAVGGVWTYALDLAEALAPRGVQTTLAVLGPGPDGAAAAPARVIPGLELVETGMPLDWMATCEGEIRNAAAVVAALARRHQAEIVQLNTPALASVASFPCPAVGVCHSCLATWWTAVREGDMPEDFRWRALANWRGLSACNLIVAPSDAFADAVARAYETPRPRTVYNGRKPPALRPHPRRRQVFTAGRLWDDGKNVAALDAAAALIDAPVFAAGPLGGPAGNAVRLRRAHALGALSPQEVGDWLARTPVFASLSLYEPFGLSVLEAAQAGCALVLSDIPTFRELWGEAAVFVPPNDPRKTAEALRRLLDAPDEAGRLGRAAQARARRYSVEAMAAGMLDAYRLLLASRPTAKRTAAA